MINIEKKEKQLTLLKRVTDSEPNGTDKSPAVSAFRIFLVVTAYWFISITLVFLNKYLLSSPDLKLNAPLFVTWYQCVISVLLCFCLSMAAKVFPSFIRSPELSIELKLCLKILPLSLTFMAMTACNNLCLKHVGVAFYFVVRSLTTIFIVVCSYFVLKQTTSMKALFCCAVIMCGFFLGVFQENALGSLSIMGVIFGVLSSVFIAMYTVSIKDKLPVVDNNVWKLTLYNNLNATFLFVPVIVFAESDNIASSTNLSSPFFWLMMNMGGVFGFTIAYVSGLQIHFTSPLTHNISGTTKACVQTIFATVYFHEIKTALWWLSNLIVLVGSATYTHVRREEMTQFNVADEDANQGNIAKDSDLTENA